jgi:hypothetical protein
MASRAKMLFIQKVHWVHRMTIVFSSKSCVSRFLFLIHPTCGLIERRSIIGILDLPQNKQLFQVLPRKGMRQSPLSAGNSFRQTDHDIVGRSAHCIHLFIFRDSQLWKLSQNPSRDRRRENLDSDESA